MFVTWYLLLWLQDNSRIISTIYRAEVIHIEFLRHSHRFPSSVIDGGAVVIGRIFFTVNGAIVFDHTILDDCAMMGKL
jgi:hypothetical protein